MSVTVSDTPMQFHFDIDNCCNCCIPRTRLKDKSPVYINKSNKVELFDYKKSDDVRRDVEKSLKRIKTYTKDLCFLIEEEGVFNFEQRQVITVRDIKDINSILKTKAIHDANQRNRFTQKHKNNTH